MARTARCAEQLECALTDITERKRAEMEPRNSLHEKRILLEEPYRRVNNSLQLVLRLLSGHRRLVQDPFAREVLQELARRLAALAGSHPNWALSPPAETGQAARPFAAVRTSTPIDTGTYRPRSRSDVRFG
jgi:two-component sensor histidine kinase